MMRSVVFQGPKDIRLVELPIPEPGPGEVRLRVTLAGICATDIHIYQGRFSVRPPRVLGHELVGVVDAVGLEVPRIWLGKHCGVSPARFCGECLACKRGFPELCENFACLGNTHHGGYAEFCLCRADQLVPLDDIQDEAAVWLEPLACVLHAIEASQIKNGEKIIIIGAGVLGRLMIQALNATLQIHIAVVDPNRAKIEHAIAIGAETGWAVAHSGSMVGVDNQIQAWAIAGIQAFIDTSGSPIAIERAVNWAGNGAKGVLFGVYPADQDIRISPNLILNKEITLTAAAGMTPYSFKQAETLLLKKAIDPTQLISQIISLEEVPGIFDNPTVLKAGKILIQPDRGHL